MVVLDLSPHRRRKDSNKKGQTRDACPLSTNLIGALQCDDIFRLRAFLTLGDPEFHFLAFGQRLEAATADGAEMCEHILAASLLDKTKTLCFVEPFDGSLVLLLNERLAANCCLKDRLALKTAGRRL